LACRNFLQRFSTSIRRSCITRLTFISHSRINSNFCASVITAGPRRSSSARSRHFLLESIRSQRGPRRGAGGTAIITAATIIRSTTITATMITPGTTITTVTAIGIANCCYSPALWITRAGGRLCNRPRPNLPTLSNVFTPLYKDTFTEDSCQFCELAPVRGAGLSSFRAYRLCREPATVEPLNLRSGRAAGRADGAYSKILNAFGEQPGSGTNSRRKRCKTSITTRRDQAACG
jgi:hypothetical protein